MRDVTEIALRRGFIFPSAEIYGGIAGFYDFGPLGFMLKKKLQNFWEEFFVRSEGAYQIETSTILPEIVLKASGHVDHFADPLTQCLKCKTMHRADQIILKAIGKFVE
ncbi:MAG: glycine--tRNA ligase, partial [Candidatus Methanofastidiosia archaeon]